MRAVVMVSGGGTNLQAILDAVGNGTITNTEICGVISNRADAYALERANKAGIPAVCVSRKAYATRAEFETALLAAVDAMKPDLIVLAGFLWLVPASLIAAYPQKIINIHPALLPKFGGKGMYGHHVHEAVVAAKEQQTGITIHYVN